MRQLTKFREKVWPEVPGYADVEVPDDGPQRVHITAADYGPPCPCCGAVLGCYCIEYPHEDEPLCPGVDRG